MIQGHKALTFDDYFADESAEVQRGVRERIERERRQALEFVDGGLVR